MSEKPAIGPAPEFNRLIFWIGVAIFLTLPVLLPNGGLVIPGMAFWCGVVFAAIFGNPYLTVTVHWTHRLLGAAMVALGAGIAPEMLLKLGIAGFCAAAVGLAVVVLLGGGIGRIFGVNHDCRWLLELGIGLAGGTAVAAAVPGLRARSRDTASVLGTVFLLNGTALTIFPLLFGFGLLDPVGFGVWAALAIPEIGGVAGATMFCVPALHAAVVVKLARSLWVLPAARLARRLGGTRNRNRAEHEIAHLHFRFPWFIPGLAAAVILFGFFPDLRAVLTAPLRTLALNLICVTLFLIGANLNLQRLKELHFRNFTAGALLWVLLAAFWGAGLAFLAPRWNWL